MLAHLVPFPARVSFTLAILVGLAVGRCDAAWRDVAGRGESSDVFFGCLILAVGVIGSALFAYCIYRALRKPVAALFLGMQRSMWLVGVPLAWLFGIGIGVMWKHL
jgi:hypothetical protein